MLTIEQISCGFGRQEILHDISLTIPEGKITAIVVSSEADCEYPFDLN